MDVLRVDPTRRGARHRRTPRWRAAVVVVAMALVASVLGATSAPSGAQTAPSTTTTTPAAGSGPLRILPLGDSITSAINGHDSYRYPLGQSLAADGCGYDFVGGLQGPWDTTLRQNVPTATPGFTDQDHEGHAGWSTGAVLDATPGWIANLDFDVAILQGGGNDFYYGVAPGPATDSRDNLGATIDALRARNPNVVVLLATTIKALPLDTGVPGLYFGWERMGELTSLIPALAAAKTTAASPVIAVDVYNGFDEAWLYDRQHPDANGEAFMAGRFRTALDPYLTCAGANQAPTVTAPAAQSSVAGTAIAPLAVAASDPDLGQTLTWSATGLPAGLAIAPTTGVISGTPTTVGSGPVTVTVTDSGTPARAASASFGWTVTAPTGGGNQAPSLTAPANQSSVAGTAIAPLAVAASDPDVGQTLTWSATGLPAGLAIAPTTGVVSGTPTTVGSSTVTVTVTDSGTPALSAAASFTWAVTAPPPPPPPAGLFRAVNLNGPAVTVGGIPFEAGATAPNVTSGPNAFCNQNVPLLPATDAATATMVRCSNWGSGTPGARVTVSAVPNGSYQLTLYVWEDNDSETFSVVVNGVTVAANVVSGPAGTWRALGPFPVSVTNGTVAVTTSGGAANLSGLVLTAGSTPPANQPPVLTVPAAQSSVQGSPIAPLAVAATDPDAGQTLTWTASGLPAGLTIASATGVIQGTPTAAGSSTVTVTATDNGVPARSATGTFTWTVTAPTGGGNQAPSVTAPANQSSVQGSPIAPLAVAATDPDVGQTLGWSATGLPAGLAIAPTTGVITGTPTTVGSSTVTVTVTDSGSPARSASASFTWAVTAPGGSSVYRAINLNGPAVNVGGVPFEAGASAANVSAGPGSFCNQAVALVPATDAATASMVRCSNWGSGSPGAQVSMAAVPAGSYQVGLYVWEDNASQSFGVVINGTTVATNVVSGPAGTWRLLGPFPVTVTNGTIAISTTGGDANLSGVVVTAVGTAPANRPPVVTNPGTQTSVQGTAIAPLALVGSDPDAGQGLRWSATGLPSGIVLDPVTGQLSGTPTVVGSNTVTVTATDDGTPARATSATFTWTVASAGGTANRAPSITSPGNQSTVQGTAISPRTIVATDPDAGQTLSFGAVGLPAGLSIAPATGTITGTPSTVGTSSVTVTATDSGSPALSASTTFTWTVTAPATSTLYRAINLNGPATTAGGIAYEAGATAPNVTSGPNAFCNQNVALSPATDPSTAALVRCSVWGNGTPGARATMTGVPNGSYQVSLHVWEDNASQTFSVVVNGATVASNVVSGGAGTWRLLGPFPVTVTDGTIAVTTSGGDANLSSLVVTRAGAPSSTAVSITAPTPGATAVVPVTVAGAASDPTGVDHVHLQIVDTVDGRYWNGSAFQVGAAEVLPTVANPGGTTTTWSYAFSPPVPSAQPYQVTATAHGLGGGVSAPTTSTFRAATAGGGTGFDPTKVTDTFVAGGSWGSTVSADWLANGHMLVLSQNGVVRDVDPTTGAATVVLDISARVFSDGESGALDVLADQAGTGYYLYYTVKGSDRLRVSHFTVGSAAEQVVWTSPGLGYDAASPYHVGGSLNLGPDGKLYLGIGDQTKGLSGDLTNVFGKVLRFGTDGSVPTDNPFYDGPGPNVDEIWAYGFRNPYRANFDRATGLFWVGDVGGNVPSQAYEEVDIAEAGQRYGWPECEGPLGPPKNGPSCPAGVTGPVFAYPHDASGSQFFNRAIVGGEIYHGSAFPLAGRYVYADYPTDSFRWLELGADGRTAVAEGPLATASSPTPVWLGVGPDGNIYWLSLGGELRRLGYTGVTNQPPTITTASATPTAGPAPLTVTFSGAATDPDGTPVTYLWDFGDGTTSTQASPSHTYAASGSYRARLQVTSGGATTSSEVITVTVGAAPTATITSPADGTTFDAGTTLTFTGTGTDPDTGALPPTALSWTIQFLHDDHAHPATTGTGSSITFPVPTTGHDYTGTTRYRVTLTATDADGLTGTTSIVVWPNKVALPVTSNASTTMTVDNVTHPLPFTVDTVVGFQHVVSVPATECVAGTTWTFSSWSDGGARSHTVTVTAGLALSATYVPGASCATVGSLRYSLSETRAAPVALQGATLARTAPVYIFLDTTIQTFARVDFWLDQPTTAPPRHTEGAHPYDFAGGGTPTAFPFDVSGLSPGSHTVTARATRTDGTSEAVTATFTVS